MILVFIIYVLIAIIAIIVLMMLMATLIFAVETAGDDPRLIIIITGIIIGFILYTANPLNL